MGSSTNNREVAVLDQAVADCFGALLAAIQASADDWRMRAAEALMDRDDTRGLECLAAVQFINKATLDVGTLQQRWQDRWPAEATALAAARDLDLTTKRPGSKLRVHLNGELLEYPNAAETFARTIEHIGLERVAKLGKALSGIELIRQSKTTGYQGQFRIGHSYVCTHSNTQTKKRLLDEIAAELRISLSVEIISEN